MKHIMIDIETLGKSEFAPLVSIGAIEFKPEENKALGREFYQVVDLGESVVGYDIDVDTLKWWMQQSDKAREVFKENGQPMQSTLVMFSQFINQITKNDDFRIWARGDLDFKILEHNCKLCDVNIPWEYNQKRDSRTFIEELIDFCPCFQEENDNEHNALSDAIYEALKVMHIMSYLRKI